MERHLNDGCVTAIRSMDGCEYESAILDAPAHRANFVHRPAKRHCPKARHAAEGRAKSGYTVDGGWADDAAEGFGPDRESNEPRGGGRPRSGAGAAGSFLGSPWISRQAAE